MKCLSLSGFSEIFKRTEKKNLSHLCNEAKAVKETKLLRGKIRGKKNY